MCEAGAGGASVIVDGQVTGVRVGMKKAGQDELLQITIYQHVANLFEIKAPLLELLHLTNFDTGYVLQC